MRAFQSKAVGKESMGEHGTESSKILLIGRWCRSGGGLKEVIATQREMMGKLTSPPTRPTSSAVRFAPRTKEG